MIVFLILILGAEVYERLNKHREDDKTRRKMLDDALVHIQVIPATAPEPWEFENLI